MRLGLTWGSQSKCPKNREVLLPSGAGQAVAAAQIEVDTEDRPLDRKFLRMGVFDAVNLDSPGVAECINIEKAS